MIHLLHSFMHDQTSKEVQLASCQPLLSAQRTKSMVAHANQCLLGSTWQGGIYNVLPWGVLSLESEDTRVETANEGRFSSQNVMQWKWVDGPIKFTHSYIIILPLWLPELFQRASLACTSINNLKKKKKIQSDKVGTGKYPFFLFSLARHGRVRRGREWWKGHPFGFFLFFFKKKLTRVQVQKTSPQVNSNQKERKVQQKVEQIFRTRA